ncbi:MAG: DsbC family protein [gamma proteobacterium symbiont of Clathrolucina costata]
MKRFFSIFFIMMAAISAAKAQPSLDAVVPINIEKIQAIESNGKLYFVSENGRFVFQGQLTDSWHKKSLDTIDEIRYAASHINLDVMGLPLDDLNTITIPGGPERIVVFVDPQCPYCKTFINDAKKKTDKYTFKIIVVPALGDKSNALSKSLFCASDKRNALNLMMTNKLDTLAQKTNCDTKHYDLTLTVAQLFGIRSIPYFISPDGRYRAGAGKDFWTWVDKQE